MKVAISVALVPENTVVKKEMITTWTQDGNIYSCTTPGIITDPKGAVDHLNEILLSAESAAEVKEDDNE